VLAPYNWFSNCNGGEQETTLKHKYYEESSLTLIVSEIFASVTISEN
jgi:hypothetical protein